MNIDTTIADSAAAKMATGSLMTLGEVAARLALSPMTVHRMPLTSIRLGRSLRFDPRDVAQLIAASREESTVRPMPNVFPSACGANAIGLNGTGSGQGRGSDDVSAGPAIESRCGEAPDAPCMASSRGMPLPILAGSPPEDRLRSIRETLTENNP